MKPSVKYGVWVTMMGQCRLICYNKDTTVVQDTQKVGGGWCMENLCTFYSIFLWPKTALKIKCINKKNIAMSGQLKI